MGFVGERLKTARLYRNMTIQELSEQISVSKQAISQYEKGNIAPKADVVFQLVTKLRFPKDFFFEEISDDMVVGNTFFRALYGSKKLDLETQRIKPLIIFKMYEFLSEYLNLPSIDLPDQNLFDGQSPEECARILRSYWKLTGEPITNVVSLLEKKGIVVSSYKTEKMNIDAYTQIYNTPKGNRYCVVLGDDKNSYVRRNFDAAHELGHIILHEGLKDISEFERSENKEIENEANRFAAEFLLPSKSFYLDLGNATKISSYIDLKKKWKVSIGAMIMRAKHLDRITNQQYQNLYKSLSAKGWRKKEPFDDEWELQKPILFKKSIRILLDHDVLTPVQIVDGLRKHGYPMLSEDIEKLLDLDSGTLSSNLGIVTNDNIVSLKQIKN